MKRRRRNWLRAGLVGRRRTGERRRAEMLGLLLRGLGVVYFFAFGSLRGQVTGLHGRRGIVPIARNLNAIRQDPALRDHPWLRWQALPTLLWVDSSDKGLVRFCAMGQLSGLALAAGVAPKLSAAAAWALYLSFVNAGSPFLAYQWDVLLLEAGFLGTLAAPAGGRMRWTRRELSPAVARTLFRLLTFRLHFESGLAKLQSGDPTWRRCTACAYHYETQPLPTPLAHRARLLPEWFHRAATAAVLVLECVAPFLIFGPRRWRRVAFGSLELLQALIAATGNFAFFNLLTAVVALSVLDDGVARGSERARSTARHALGALEDVAAELAGLFQLADLVRRIRGRRLASDAWELLEAHLAPFHLVGSYGLFAVMTRERPEIVIEGSNDGSSWQAYALPHKPGDPRQRSRFVAPGQPRLDWQLWFAALSPVAPSWFHGLVRRLLEGSPEVLALFSRNPFPEAPPRYIRALLYDYRMTDAGTRRTTGLLWHRKLLGLYYPAVRLERARRQPQPVMARP